MLIITTDHRSGVEAPDPSPMVMDRFRGRLPPLYLPISF